ncbi:hypothetical protein CBS101457_000162 [Exobasidium rhododendri]|nr:hypothetical protein CBS101457_000162 [Exobasidium rhododendri]
MDGGGHNDYRYARSQGQEAGTPRLQNTRARSSRLDEYGPSGSQTTRLPIIRGLEARRRAPRSSRSRNPTSMSSRRNNNHGKTAQQEEEEVNSEEIQQWLAPEVFASSADSAHHEGNLYPQYQYQYQDQDHGTSRPHELMQPSYDPSMTEHGNLHYGAPMQPSYETKYILPNYTDEGGSGSQQDVYTGQGTSHPHPPVIPEEWSLNYSEGMRTMHLGSQPPPQYTQESEQIVLPPPNNTQLITFKHADDDSSEYTLHFSPLIFYNSEADMIFPQLTDDQKLFISDYVHQVRPYQYRYLRSELNFSLRPSLVKDLLSGDQVRMDTAVEVLYPEASRRRGKSGTNKISWMTGLTTSQRSRVIRMLANATAQEADTLRDCFLKWKVKSEVAKQVLDLTSTTEIAQFAIDNNFVLPDGPLKSGTRWQKGASQIQRRALMQRIAATGLCEEEYIKIHLQKANMPLGYGLEMLRADERRFRRMVKDLARMQSRFDYR